MILLDNGKIKIGAEYLPSRKKPCLVVQRENEITKYATFNDEYSAEEFMDILADFVGVQIKVEQNGNNNTHIANVGIMTINM